MDPSSSQPADEETSDDSLQVARNSLLSLSVALRSIGKATSPDRMDEFGRSYPAMREALDEFVEVLPRQTGRMLADLCEEAGVPVALRASILDPRSFREAADAVEKVVDEGADSVLLAYSALPEQRWPANVIRQVGLFLIGLVHRGTASIRQLHGELWVGDAHLSVRSVEEGTRRLLGWHRTYATAAVHREAQVQAPAQAQDLGTVSVPARLLLSESESNKLGSLVILLDADLESDLRLSFRRMVGASLHVFLRLLQRPYAVVFQSHLRFSPIDGSSLFLPPSTVAVGADGDLWAVVRALAAALDHSFGGWVRPGSESGPMEAFSEAAGCSFVDFTVAYLQILVAQQGVLPKEPDPDLRMVVRKFHVQFLELLLDEQKKALVEEGRRIGSSRTENLLTAGAGAASLPLLAWLLPKAVR